MKITTVLFDLDGTLLPMDQNAFIKAYFGGLARRMATHGYDPQKLIEAIWQGTAAMVKNDGQATNEERFWQGFEAAYGKPARQDEEHFVAFYREDFDKVSTSCGHTPLAREIIDTVSSKRLRLMILGSITLDCRNGKPDPMTEAFLQIAGVFSQLELSMIRARVKSGMQNAREKGKRLGRRPTTKDDIPPIFYKHYPAFMAGTLNVSELARICGLSRPTVYKYLQLIK